ncbi:hypothetical protein D9611_003347 [Ephemerocybe angulata]|uniref:NADH-cytochrome b5 reductase n=2 Tax=Ephemerocybe angulata TaxID=980116 RepID=A0A8H5FHL2_9AGAR|nr:hypothetical protein D9611_003347 [Tulosesus angulatus]KAF6766377.1 NADH-cytochrome b5 reductase [Tulosesus angulatus]
MPNRFQLAFLATFLSVFGALVLAAHLFTSWLASIGYPIGNLILIGLDKDAPPMSNGRVEIEKIPGQVIEFVKNFDIEEAKAYLTQEKLIELAQQPAVIAAAVVTIGSVLLVKSLLDAPGVPPLNADEWKEFPLVHTKKVSPNTAIYRFKLPSSRAVLGLPIGQHIAVTANINGKNVIRNYTPVSLPTDRGYFELLIKTYELGNISKHVTTLSPGDKLRVKGPKGNFKYVPWLTNHLGMIAGGTGIAPMIQIIRAILSNPGDTTKISLIYANVSKEDILLKAELEALLPGNEDRFTLYYVLNNPPPAWDYGVGFVTKDHIKKLLPNPNETNSKILICGPPPMVGAMKKNLEDLNYPTPNTISKQADKVFVF